jgi:hypothetical protein
MVRGISILLAIGLFILWIVGLAEHATLWLSWLDGLGALCGLLIGASVGQGATRGVDVGAPVALAIGLGVLWIIGLATHAEVWLTWWTFGFACAFLILGIAGGAVTARTTTATTRIAPPRPI